MTSIEVRKLLQDPNFILFDFDYSFYNDSVDDKNHFERLFEDHFFFHRIGFETVARFKHSLRSKLNVIAPKYVQLYESELKSKNIEFLLNKDYTETYTREIDRINNEKLNEQINNSKKSDSKVDVKNDSSNDINQSNNNTNKSKNSDLDGGVSEANLTQGYLTGVSENIDSGNTNTKATDKSSNNSVGSATDIISGTTVGSKDVTNNDKENYTLVGKGNIGTTSSAALLREWRSVMININEMMLDECRDLFMLVY